MTTPGTHTVDATSVACPTCGAWVGWACEGADYGYHGAGYHPSREEAAARAVVSAQTTPTDPPTADTKEAPCPMTREGSLLMRLWWTNDGDVLEIAEIDDDHLRALLGYLRDALTPGRAEDACRVELAAWMADHAAGAHAIDDEMDLDLYRAGWIQIVNDEIARRPA